jgi:predicted CoA-binding protein
MRSIKQILSESKTIAVVGLSPKEEKASHRVALYLREHGYRIIPVNPGYSEILGEKCYKSLKGIPERIDIVDIFRKAEDVPPVVDDAIAVGAKVVWIQLGIVNEEAAAKARGAGLEVVMDKCIKIEHELYK